MTRTAAAWMAGLVLGTVHGTWALPSVPGSGGDLPAVGSAGGPSRALSTNEARRWLAGSALFARENEKEHGLGDPRSERDPGFNALSCAECHKDPAPGGAGGRDVDVVTLAGMSQYGDVSGGTLTLHLGRPFQTPDEADKATEVPRNRLEPLRKLRDELLTKRNGRAALLEVLQTPSLLGLGLIDSIPDEEILRNEDPEDRNGDGVRGVALRIPVGDRVELGRFGWRAEVPRLADFVCRALGGELGLTAPDQGRGFGLAHDADPVADPELPQEALDDLAFYVQNLAAPRGEEGGDPAELRHGAYLFEATGCAVCHVPTLIGREEPVRLYSDLLLHRIEDPTQSPRPRFSVLRVRAEDDDPPKTPPSAPEGHFRTAPLWGVARTAPYLHDGSATTLADAVRAHAAEAAGARQLYERLSEPDQRALLSFLASL